MSWFHTWVGIALSGVLFAIFWMGTLTIFHYEIDKWMMPEKRIAQAVDTSFDEKVWPIIQEKDLSDAKSIFLARPKQRAPLTRTFILKDDGRENAYYDSNSGEEVTLTKSLGAGRFFYPFHYMLHISWAGLGYWIVGLASMGMLSLLVSGIFIHRKIIQDFFTFRPKKQARRSLLDMHNITSLIALPFHVLFPLSGLLIFIFVYFPGALKTPFAGDRDAYFAEKRGHYARALTGVEAPLPTSIDTFITRAEDIWTQRDGMPAHADYIRVENIGDKNTYVIVQHSFPKRRVGSNQGYIAFDAQSREVLFDFTPKPISKASNWLTGAHFMLFDHWPLRWLLFLGGLSSCAMIATGLVFWMRARIKKGAEPTSVRVIRATSIGTVTGMMLASISFMAANRMLTNDSVLFGVEREFLEVGAFAFVWIGSFVHASLRNKNAWAEQCLAITFVCILAVFLNWITTGDNIVSTINGGLWSIAMIDIVLISSAAAAFFAAKRLKQALLSENTPPRRMKSSRAQAVAAE